jgi:hypothetical protein
MPKKRSTSTTKKKLTNNKRIRNAQVPRALGSERKNLKK